MNDDTPSALIPLSRDVATTDGTLTVRRMTGLQTLQAANSLFTLYEALDKAPEGAGLAQVLAGVPIAAIDLIATSCDADFDTVADLDPVELLDLAEAWAEVNGRFFVERVLPRVLQLMGALRKSAAPQTSPAQSKKPSTTSRPRGRAASSKR